MGEWTAELAESYAEKYGEYATNRLGVDAIELDSTATVLDIGCGAGAALRRAALRVTEGVLIGVDPVPRMLEIARERAGGVQLDLRVGSASALPVDDHSCDVVLAFDSLDHWKDVRHGLAEVFRVLKPGARFVVVKDGTVPASNPTSDVLRAAGFRILRAETFGDEVDFSLWVAST